MESLSPPHRPTGCGAAPPRPEWRGFSTPGCTHYLGPTPPPPETRQDDAGRGIPAARASAGRLSVVDTGPVSVAGGTCLPHELHVTKAHHATVFYLSCSFVACFRRCEMEPPQPGLSGTGSRAMVTCTWQPPWTRSFSSSPTSCSNNGRTQPMGRDLEISCTLRWSRLWV